MKKYIYLILFSILISCGGNQQYIQEIASQRMKQNEEFFNKSSTPLDSHLFEKFTGLKFFEIDEKYKVEATIEKLDQSPIFDLPHSHDRTKPYRVYGYATFKLNEKPYKLTLLEAVNKKTGYDKFILIPFGDKTNGNETYGGGRYIDITIPEGNKAIIDFNMAYNPYCAYSAQYTCPIPPKENILDVEIKSGQKYEFAGTH